MVVSLGTEGGKLPSWAKNLEQGLVKTGIIPTSS